MFSRVGLTNTWGPEGKEAKSHRGIRIVWKRKSQSFRAKCAIGKYGVFVVEIISHAMAVGCETLRTRKPIMVLLIRTRIQTFC